MKASPLWQRVFTDQVAKIEYMDKSVDRYLEWAADLADKAQALADGRGAAAMPKPDPMPKAGSGQ